MIASCGYEIKFHDWESSTCIAIYKPPSEKKIHFQDLSWNATGKLIAAVPVSGRASIIKPHQSLRFHNDPEIQDRDIINVSCVKTARFSRVEPCLLALGTSIGHLLHYNVTSKYAKVLVDDLPASANFIEYGAEDAYMAVGCGNGQIFILREEISITESYFVPHSDRITALVAHPNITYYLAGGSDKGVIAIWDLNTCNYSMQTSSGDSQIVDIAFSPNDDTFISITQDQKVAIHDRRTCSRVHEKQFDLKLTSLVYSPDGNEIAIGTEKGYILCMDKRYLKSSRSGIKAHDSCIKKMKFQREYFNLLNPPESEDTLLNSLSQALTAERDVNFDLSDNKDKSMRLDASFTLAQKTSGIKNKNCKVTSSPCLSHTSDASLYHIVNEKCLKDLRQDVMQSMGDLMDKVMEQINSDFLKMRMNVSREFCAMEMRNRDRWQEFNEALLKIACLDDRCVDEDILLVQRKMHEAVVNENEYPNKTSPKNGSLEGTDDSDTDNDVVHLDREMALCRQHQEDQLNSNEEKTKGNFTACMPRQTYSFSERRASIIDGDFKH